MSENDRNPLFPDEDAPVDESQEKARPTVYSVDFGSSEQRFSSVEAPKNKRYDDDDFWDLGETRRKVYQKPSFSDKPIENTLIQQKSEQTGGVSRESIPPAAKNDGQFSSKLYQRAADRTEIPTASYGGRQVRTSRYQASRPESARAVQNRANEALRNAKTIKEYDCSGLLIRHVEIKPWAANVQFYQRFAAEAEIFHGKTGSPCDAVEFFAYVPQYSKMNDKQQNFYLYVRDSIRNGQYISADLSYLLLYIFEIINLPHLIPPEEGVRLLSDIWLNYRDRHPRLDVFLCEWMADYCLIHGVPLPRRLTPLLSGIVQKAQFKEFYLDLLPDNSMASLAKILLEFSSDYDYRRSRYYKGNEEAYEEKLSSVLAAVLQLAHDEKRGIFAFEKKYRQTRDAYCGAVTPAEIKRRIDVEFYSFTRPLETREIITNLVKYAENQLRLTLKIKAKLGVGDLDPRDREAIDRFFAPMMPKKRGRSAAAEEDYLKLYEAETTGFDFEAASEIEQMSWDNTNKLTAAEVNSAEVDFAEPKPAENEITRPEPAAMEEQPQEIRTESHTSESNTNDTAEKECLRAALDGSFRRFCHDHGYFADDMASKINELFLDIIGDIVLAEENGDYQLIEDYREDVTEWLN